MFRFLLISLQAILFSACLPQPSDNNIVSIDGEKPPAMAAINPNDTLFETETHLITGPTWTEVLVLPKEEFENAPADFEVMIGSEDYTVFAKDVDYKDLTCYRKFTPTTTFEDHQVSVYDGPLASPDLDSHPLGLSYRTRIRKACSEGINFGGHYTLVTWGCGSPCQSGVLVDRMTGKIVDGHATNHGAEFRKDSNLLIADASIIQESGVFRMTGTTNVQVRVWTGKGWEVLEQF